MVVFTCQNCGSTVNKNKVEKHYTFECKTYPYVTCVDCLKDFKGDEYVAHTQCITEDQKYGSKDYVPKVSSGVKKRATWLNSVESSLETPGLTNQQRKMIEDCLSFSNIPQKKQKFINFIHSGFGRRYPDSRFVESVFDILDACHKKNVEQEKSQNNNNGNLENGDKSTGDDSKTENGINTSSNDVSMENGKKSKKRKHTEESESAGQADSEIVEKKKKKKDKKNHKDSEAKDFQNTTVEDQDVTKENNDDSNIDPINNHNQETDEADKKLTKKERKEKKKRAKYEAELNEIANSKNENHENLENSNGVENNDHDNTEAGTKKKKKKKDKMKHINEINTEITNGIESSGKKRQPEENGSAEPVKKKKKGSHLDNIQENNNGVIESNTTNSDATFKWDEMIIKVLESRSDKELSINRLSKKIINEYQAIYGEDHMTYEKLISKFNKKVYKTPGVKVLKDKAKLIT